MTDGQFCREEMLIGSQALERLRRSRVIVFGVGGVGSAAVEALARAGVGNLCLVDPDVAEASNINRQLIALHSTLGLPKAEAARRRILDIDPECEVEVHICAYNAETADSFDLAAFDYAADCIDMTTSKLLLAERCAAAGTRLISCMGTGNKIDPTQFQVTDISKTSGDGLARVMRRELGRRGIKHLPVVWSPEPPYREPESRMAGTISFVPLAAGLALAGKIIRDLMEGT